MSTNDTPGSRLVPPESQLTPAPALVDGLDMTLAEFIRLVRRVKAIFKKCQQEQPPQPRSTD